jgi:hypothetical protein
MASGKKEALFLKITLDRILHLRFMNKGLERLYMMLEMLVKRALRETSNYLALILQKHYLFLNMCF